MRNNFGTLFKTCDAPLVLRGGGGGRKMVVGRRQRRVVVVGASR